MGVIRGRAAALGLGSQEAEGPDQIAPLQATRTGANPPGARKAMGTSCDRVVRLIS